MHPMSNRSANKAKCKKTNQRCGKGRLQIVFWKKYQTVLDITTTEAHFTTAQKHGKTKHMLNGLSKSFLQRNGRFTR